MDAAYDHQILNALFGKEMVMYESNKKNLQFSRNGDGFWKGETRWLYRRVSAILITKNINPWTIFNVDESQVRIFYHPDPEHSAQKFFFNKLTSCVVDKNGNIIFNKGESSHQILDLPYCWF